MRALFVSCVLSCIITAFLGTRFGVCGAIGPSAKSYDTPSVVMSIVGGDVDGNGEHEIITGSVDGTYQAGAYGRARSMAFRLSCVSAIRIRRAEGRLGLLYKTLKDACVCLITQAKLS